MYVGVTIVRAVVAALQRQGISVDALCARAQIDPADIADAALRVSIDRYDRILRASRELSTDAALGLHVGDAAPAGALNVVGYIVATCGTIRDAFAQFLQYSPLIKEAGRWQLLEDRAHARFVYQHDVVAPDNACIDAEACLSLVHTIGRRFIDAKDGLDVVRFRHPAPSYGDEYRRIFRCDVLFDQPANELVFARHLLDVEQAHRDDRLRAHLKARAEEMLAQRNSDDAFFEQLRDLFRMEVETGEPQVPRLAARLGMSLRSLERHVRERGLSLADLLEQARRDAACAALSLSLGSIKEVAYQLGFSEPSAFHRAFKRWTGMTPARYRETRVQAALRESRST